MDPLSSVRLTALMERTDGSPDVTVGLVDGPVVSKHPNHTETMERPRSLRTPEPQRPAEIAPRPRTSFPEVAAIEEPEWTRRSGPANPKRGFRVSGLPASSGNRHGAGAAAEAQAEGDHQCLAGLASYGVGEHQRYGATDGIAVFA